MEKNTFRRSAPQGERRRRGNGHPRNQRPQKARSAASVALQRPHFVQRKQEDRPSSARAAHSRNDGEKKPLPVKGISASAFPATLVSASPKQFPKGPTVRVIPMGGLNEVGLNMTAFECGDDIFVIDTGMGFGGGDRYPGIDYVLPDVTYLEQNRHKIRGLIYTHGHLDHIGGAPYILPRLGNTVPIFGPQFALELVRLRLQEFGLDKSFRFQQIDADQSLTLGVFKIQFFRLNHSIPDVVGLSIDTPMGRVLYCTDWKFDHLPFDNQISDYHKLATYGTEGVRLLMTDALGVLKPGNALSEKEIEANILEVFKKCENRIIFTSFSSNIARMQAVINCCVATGRKLALVGRSMDTNFSAAFRLGKIKVPPDLMVDVAKTQHLTPEKICILSTGNQGEDASALSRMARGEHPLVRLQAGDAVIFSSSPIPGNEASVQDLMTMLSQIGVEIYYKQEYDIHSSGHACVKDLELLFMLTKPDYLQPIHGEHFMLVRAARLGAKMGIPADHCLVGMNGRITELDSETVQVTDEVITDKYLMVDGSGVGTVSDVVLEERRTMKEEGAIIVVLLLNRKKEIVSGPEIISRGFVYMKNNQSLFDEIKNDLRTRLKSSAIDPKSESFFSELRQFIKNSATDIIVRKTEKNPMIIPVVVQV